MPTRDGRWYFWGTVDGQTVFLGGELTEQKAIDAGMARNFDNSLFDWKYYPTIDKNRAIQMWKYEQSEKDGDLRMALRPVKRS